MTTQSAGPDDPDPKDDSRNGTWKWGEVTAAVVVALVLVSPLALIGWSLARAPQPPSTADVTQLVKSIEGIYWPLIGFFAVIVFRGPIARLIGRIEQLRGPGGWSANLTKQVREATRAQTRRNRSNPPRTDVPSPQEGAPELPPDVADTDKPVIPDQEK